ncbi:MAG TPA: hypothetical protein DEP05_00540 [Betaproteobacteria bacterium]|nr:hypothetical protein [Betaproteobacteria bacterium]
MPPFLRFRLIWLALWLTAGAAQAAPAPQPAYPDVWLRRGATAVLYPSARDADRFRLSNGLPDVVLTWLHFHQSRSDRVAGVLETFFGGRKFLVKSYGHKAIVTLANGAKVQLNDSPPKHSKAWRRAGRMMPFAGNLPSNVLEAVKFANGALLGIENLRVYQVTSRRDDYGCQPATSGLVWRNARGEVEWRKTLVAMDGRAASASDLCNITPQQRTLFDASGLAPLPDGTVLVDLRTAQVRVDPAAGAFRHLPRAIRALDSKTLLAFKRALFARLNNDSGWMSRQYNTYRYGDMPYSLLTQYFVFPDQLAR